MNLGTAASIGIGLLQHRQEIASALNGTMGAGKGLGKLVLGEGFAKVAEKFDLNLKGGNAGHALHQHLHQQAPGLPQGDHTLLQAMGALAYFDADKNGEVSRQELTDGLSKLETAGLRNSGGYGNLYSLGEQLLKNYDNATALDGNTQGIGYRDMLNLAGQDGKVGVLSAADWSRLNA